MGYILLTILCGLTVYYLSAYIYKIIKKWLTVDFDGYLSWSMARISNQDIDKKDTHKLIDSGCGPTLQQVQEWT